MINTASHDPQTAIAVFNHGLTVLQGAQYRHANLGLFTEAEATQFDAVVALVTQYLELPVPPRPLCLAVFGAPGSGKSRLVRQLPGLLGSAGETLSDLAEINLTQVTSVDNLASALADAGNTAGHKVPFVFFDEFDTKLEGVPLGWLFWFLAPMQDGEFRYIGKRMPLKRAIYVFAGGTASSFSEFMHADPALFSQAKGPDFVSRLRGYLNIVGINAEDERSLRRATVLRYQLKTHKKEVEDALRDALLHVGRYKHGARSVESLIELMPLKDSAVMTSDIRDHPLLGMHVDRGPLDAKRIGGCIALSCSDFLAANFQDVLRHICEALFRDGATIACGGQGAPEGLIKQLTRVVADLPERLEPGGAQQILLPAEQVPPPQDHRVELLETMPQDPDEHSCAEVLRLFRMRYQLALRFVAQFALSGRLDRPVPAGAKRFPGVAEELMLALAMKHPVYISGAFGGAAQWAGTLLALGRHWKGALAGFDEDWLKIPAGYESLFRPPPYDNLPLTRADLVDFFRQHAIGGPKWIENGLSAEENREMFETSDRARITVLVRQGLHRRFLQTTP